MIIFIIIFAAEIAAESNKLRIRSLCWNFTYLML